MSQRLIEKGRSFPLFEIEGDPSSEGFFITDPQHGGKVTCKKCDCFLDMGKNYVFVLKPEGHKDFYCEAHNPIQDNCVKAYVLPDRCRYSSTLGCDCGAYLRINRHGRENL